MQYGICRTQIMQALCLYRQYGLCVQVQKQHSTNMTERKDAVYKIIRNQYCLVFLFRASYVKRPRSVWHYVDALLALIWRSDVVVTYASCPKWQLDATLGYYLTVGRVIDPRQSMLLFSCFGLWGPVHVNSDTLNGESRINAMSVTC